MWGPTFSPLTWITAIPVVEGGPCQHHRVLIGPFWGVAPPPLSSIPVVTACWIAHNSLWKTVPYNKGKIHLQTKNKSKNSVSNTSSTDDLQSTYIVGPLSGENDLLSCIGYQSLLYINHHKSGHSVYRVLYCVSHYCTENGPPSR